MRKGIAALLGLATATAMVLPKVVGPTDGPNMAVSNVCYQSTLDEKQKRYRKVRNRLQKQSRRINRG